MGNDFWDGAQQGAMIGGVTGMIGGGYEGFLNARNNGLNNWWGSEVAYNRDEWSFINSKKPDYTIDMKIPDVGSQLDADCVPTSFAEIEARRSGSRTYMDFKTITNYQKEVGVEITGNEFRKLVNRTFNDVNEIANNRAINNLFDPNYMQKAANNGEAFLIHFKRHADVVRGLEVYTRAPRKNTLIFRQSKFNFSRTNPSIKPIFSIFQFF